MLEADNRELPLTDPAVPARVYEVSQQQDCGPEWSSQFRNASGPVLDWAFAKPFTWYDTSLPMGHRVEIGSRPLYEYRAGCMISPESGRYRRNFLELRDSGRHLIIRAKWWGCQLEGFLFLPERMELRVIERCLPRELIERKWELWQDASEKDTVSLNGRSGGREPP